MSTDAPNLPLVSTPPPVFDPVVDKGEDRAAVARDARHAGEKVDARIAAAGDAVHADRTRTATTERNVRLTKGEMRSAQEAAKSLQLPPNEQIALQTLLPTLVSTELETEPPQGDGLPDNYQPEIADPGKPKDAADLAAERRIDEKPGASDATKPKAHGDEGETHQPPQVDKKIYGNNTASALDRTLAKALPTPQAQQAFAKALQANAVPKMQEAFAKLPPHEKTAALRETLALVKALQMAVRRTLVQGQGTARLPMLYRALSQAQSLVKALAPQVPEAAPATPDAPAPQPREAPESHALIPQPKATAPGQGAEEPPAPPTGEYVVLNYGDRPPTEEHATRLPQLLNFAGGLRTLSNGGTRLAPAPVLTRPPTDTLVSLTKGSKGVGTKDGDKGEATEGASLDRSFALGMRRQQRDIPC